MQPAPTAQPPSYVHPFSFGGFIDTKFFTTAEELKAVTSIDQSIGNEPSKTVKQVASILRGQIHWQANDQLFISNDRVFIALDDAIGQGNKILPFGVTAYLKVDFKKVVPNQTASTVEIAVVERSTSTKANLQGKYFFKTLCTARLLSAEGELQATAEALFIETPFYTPPTSLKLDEQSDPHEPVEVKRLQPYTVTNQNTGQMVGVEKITATDSVISAEVHWINGQGPKNHVHGGVVSMPIHQIIQSIYGKAIASLKIQYKKPIPLGSSSTLRIEGTAVTCYKTDQASNKVIEFEGQVSLTY